MCVKRTRLSCIGRINILYYACMDEMRIKTSRGFGNLFSSCISAIQLENVESS